MFEQRASRHVPWFFGACALCSTLAGCSDPGPCPGVVEGASYQVELGEPSSEDSPSDCHDNWGFSNGSSLAAKMSKVAEGGSCKVGQPELDGLPGWTFERISDDDPNNGFVRSSYRGTFKDCTASVRLHISKGAGGDCFENGGKTSQCQLSLLINGQGGGECAQICATSLVATVTRE